MLYMVTFTINIPQMLAYIPAPWILWVILIDEEPRYLFHISPMLHMFTTINITRHTNHQCLLVNSLIPHTTSLVKFPSATDGILMLILL